VRLRGTWTGTWWVLVALSVLLGCANGRANTAAGTASYMVSASSVELVDDGREAAEEARRRPARKVSPEAYAAFANGVLLDQRSLRLRFEAQRTSFLNRKVREEKSRRSAEVWERARAELQQAVKLDPKGVEPARYLGMALANRGLIEEAIPYVQRARELAPEGLREELILPPLAKLWVAVFRQKLTSETGVAAVEPLSRALDEDPMLPEAQEALRELVVVAAREEDFLKKAREAVPADERGFGYHYIVGWVAFAGGDWQMAERDLGEALKVRPDYWPAVLNRAMALAELDRTDGALAVLSAARSRGLEEAHYHMFTGIIQARARQYAEAEKSLGQALRLAPDNVTARYQLAGVYEMQGNMDRAIDELKTNLTIDHGHAPSLNALGYFYAEKEVNLDEAERLVRRALLEEPDNGAYLDSLGWVYFKEGKLQQALEKLSRAAQILPDPVVYEHLGDVHEKLGNVGEAIEWWRKAVELDPDAEGPRRKLQTIGHREPGE